VDAALGSEIVGVRAVIHVVAGYFPAIEIDDDSVVALAAQFEVGVWLAGREARAEVGAASEFLFGRRADIHAVESRIAVTESARPSFAILAYLPRAIVEGGAGEGGMKPGTLSAGSIPSSGWSHFQAEVGGSSTAATAMPPKLCGGRVGVVIVRRILIVADAFELGEGAERNRTPYQRFTSIDVAASRPVAVSRAVMT
jgi:hypothetical protein